MKLQTAVNKICACVFTDCGVDGIRDDVQEALESDLRDGARMPTNEEIELIVCEADLDLSDRYPALDALLIEVMT